MSLPGAPLSGVRVLDCSRVLAGPHCGRLLVDLGADVIKVEPPEGDMTRFGAPRVNSLATGFVQQNNGKRNISLDLRKPEASALLVRIAEEVDVVLENFRPGVMDRMGLGYSRLRDANPRLVYASITGYGQSGPWSDRRAYAPVVAGEVGLLDLFATYRHLDIAQEVFSHADLYSALFCLSGILAALYERERTGRGQHVDVAMAESMLCVNEYAGTILSGYAPDPSRLPATVASPVFDTKDGHKITTGGDPAVRENFYWWCQAMGREDLRDDPRFARAEDRVANREELLEILQAWVGGFDDLDDLGARLEAGGLAFGIIRTVAELGASEWAAARGAVVEVSDRGEGTFKLPNSPWRFSETSSGVRGEPAYRGEHNREVLRELLEMSDAEIAALEEAEVLSSRGPSEGSQR